MKLLHLHSGMCAAVLALFTISANAALVPRLGGLAYYDDEADLTWLADANYSFTSGGEEFMDWTSANEWAAGLTVDGVGGWRLPSALNGDGTGPCSGYDCTGSELGNMFYNVLGGAAFSSILTTHNSSYDLFSNIGQVTYWSGTERADATTSAWTFRFDTGEQRSFNKSVAPVYAWAVRSGDVNTVPVPAAIWLFGTGLIGLIGIARKKAA